MEYFVNRKYEDQIVDLLGFTTNDSLAFKKLKRSAVYRNKKMERDILIREIVSFCLDYGVLVDIKEIECKIKQGLE